MYFARCYTLSESGGQRVSMLLQQLANLTDASACSFSMFICTWLWGLRGRLYGADTVASATYMLYCSVHRTDCIPSIPLLWVFMRTFFHRIIHFYNDAKSWWKILNDLVLFKFYYLFIICLCLCLSQTASCVEVSVPHSTWVQISPTSCLAAAAPLVSRTAVPMCIQLPHITILFIVWG